MADWDDFEADYAAEEEEAHKEFSEKTTSRVVRFLLDGEEKAAANLLLSCAFEFQRKGIFLGEDDFGLEFDYQEIVIIFARRRAYDILVQSEHALTSAVYVAFNAVLPGCEIRLRPLIEDFTGDWRKQALEQINSTDGGHNQASEEWSSGIVTWERLRFRSQTEIKIAMALDAAGVLFLPNCRGRVGSVRNRKSVEADFLIYAHGKIGILEVDGPHHVASKDHDRDSLFFHHSVSLVRHFDAGRCYRDPDGVVKEFLELLSKQSPQST